MVKKLIAFLLLGFLFIPNLAYTIEKDLREMGVDYNDSAPFQSRISLLEEVEETPIHTDLATPLSDKISGTIYRGMLKLATVKLPSVSEGLYYAAEMGAGCVFAKVTNFGLRNIKFYQSHYRAINGGLGTLYIGASPFVPFGNAFLFTSGVTHLSLAYQGNSNNDQAKSDAIYKPKSAKGCCGRDVGRKRSKRSKPTATEQSTVKDS